MTADTITADPTGPAILITGGAGFIGRAVLAELAKPGETAVLRPREVRVIDVRPGALADRPDITAIAGDIRSPDDLRRACRDIDVVIHCAAIIDWGHGPDQLVQAVNVTGTENVIAACAEAGVQALVHTSSEDVVYTGKPIVDGDETLPYATHFHSAYCRTKTLSEQLVLRADGLCRAARPHPARRADATDATTRRLRTTAIRPVGVYGEGDPLHIGSLLQMAERMPLIRIGDGSGRCQHVYVGNVAHALLLAARNLLETPDRAGGRAFFITDSAPANFFDFFEPIITAAGKRMLPPSLSLPHQPLRAIGAALEGLSWLLRPVLPFNPKLSRFSVDFVCHDFTFKSDQARECLGYQPVYSQAAAMARTVDHYRRPS